VVEVIEKCEVIFEWSPIIPPTWVTWMWMLLGYMLRNSIKEIFSKTLYIQFIKKLKIKCNAHIPINYIYI